MSQLQRLYGNPIVTNASVNRSLAIRCFEAGATPEQIAAEWPEVWFCRDGKLGQRYDSIFPDGRKETRYMIREDTVEPFLERLGLR